MQQPARAGVMVRRLVGLGLTAMMIPAMMLGTGRASTPVFGTPVPLKDAGSISEPGIDIGPDGTVFVNGITGLPTHSHLWRSTTGGATFDKITFPVPYSRFPGGGDADVVVGADKRVYFLDLSAVSNSIARSEDNGTTWKEGTPFTTLPLSDRQWIGLGKRGADGKDTVYVVYHLIQPPQSILFARSRDGGMTWDWHSAPVGLGGAIPGQLVSDGDFVAFNYESQGTMYVVVSTDAGTTWKRHAVTWVQQAADNLTALTIDPVTKHFYIAWINRHEFTVEVARSIDMGETWSREVTVSSGEKSNMFPWIHARNGKVAVAWYGAEQMEDPGEFTEDPNTVPASTEWKVRYVETTDWDAGFTSPVDATPVVKRGIICTYGLDCRSGRELGDFLQVAIDADGKSLISYVNATRGGGSVVKQL